MKKIFKISILSALLLSALLLASCASSGEAGGTSQTEAHVHKVIHWQTVSEAGCESAGVRFGTCIDCKNEVREKSEAPGHIYGDSVCLRCGADDTSSGLELTLNTSKKGYIVSGVKNEYITDIVIPSQYRGLPVTEIGGGAFSETSVISVTVPGSVKRIGDSAFSGCTKLKRVELVGGIETISSNAFYACESLEEISIPDGVTVLGAGAFRLCKSLERAKLPDTLGLIDEYTFAGCTELESVNIPEKCGLIGKYAFNKCEQLTEIELTENLILIGDYAFSYSGLENVKFPRRLQSIGDGAFEGSALCYAEISASVIVGSRAFAECMSLESVRYANYSYGYIGAKIFADCKNLKYAEIDAETLPYEIFMGCEALERVKISEKLQNVRDRALRDCAALSVIDYAGTPEQWEEIGKSAGWDADIKNYTVNFVNQDGFPS